ncbi:MAG: tyrosine recombinase XerC [Gammaproteobacteria bacterium]|nr:tyrosine recombinase XerC [Gammaproteobacteria bacterium]
MSTGDDLTLINTYLTYIAENKRFSAHSVAAYRRDLLRAREFFTGADRDSVRWTDIAPDQVRMFVMRQHQQGRNGRSIARALSALRGFYRYLMRMNLAQRNPATGISAPKAPRRLPEVLDVDRAAQLVDVHDTDWLSVRDRAMLELLYSSGLRLAELVSLNVAVLNKYEGTVRVLGKGQKERIVPVGQAAWVALDAWLAQRSLYVHDDESALFVTRNGTRLRARAVQLRVALWGRAQGMSVGVYPHMLRHSCASHVLESSGDLRAVQELLGHAHLTTTQIYTHLDYQHLANVYDQTHPRAKREK